MAAPPARCSWCRRNSWPRRRWPARHQPLRRAYIIRNGHVAPEYKPVKAKTLSIAGRAVSSLIKSQGVGDLYELFVFAKKNGIDYNLAYIPGDFPDTSTQAFDPVYMSKLYDLGFQHGRSRLSVEEGPAAHGRALNGPVGKHRRLGVELRRRLAYTGPRETSPGRMERIDGSR